MKPFKTITLALSSAAIVFATGVANASMYVGADAQYNMIEYNSKFKDAQTASKVSLDKNTPGLGLYLGKKFDKNFAVEGGFNYLADLKSKEGTLTSGAITTQTDVKTKVYNLYVDALGYMPVMGEELNLVGALGVGYLREDTTTKMVTSQTGNPDVTTESSDKRNKIGFRAGVGLQYAMNKNLSARVMLRYQHIGGDKADEALKNYTTASVGLVYQI